MDPVPARLAAALAGALLACAVARAHDTWILATPSDGASRRAVRLDMTSGMAFPALESRIRPERVTRAMVRASGESRPLPAPKRRSSIAIVAAATRAGTSSSGQ
jgi:hypothetical protein